MDFSSPNGLPKKKKKKKKKRMVAVDEETSPIILVEVVDQPSQSQCVS